MIRWLATGGLERSSGSDLGRANNRFGSFRVVHCHYRAHECSRLAVIVGAANRYLSFSKDWHPIFKGTRSGHQPSTRFLLSSRSMRSARARVFQTLSVSMNRHGSLQRNVLEALRDTNKFALSIQRKYYFFKIFLVSNAGNLGVAPPRRQTLLPTRALLCKVSLKY